MRFDATFPFPNAMRWNSGGFAPALVLILAALLAAAHPARGAGLQAPPPAAKRPGNARPAVNQSAPPNAAGAPNAVPAQSAVQTTAPIAEQVLRQHLIQDPFRVAIDQAVQKGKQEAAANTAAKSPAKTTATQTTPVATGTAPPNATQNGPDSTNTTPSGPPAVNGDTNPNESAAETLVCKGTRVNGAAFTFPFEANTSPAPAAGDACVPSGKQMPKGTAMMGTAPKASTVFAVVFVPPAKAGGANTGEAGPAAATLVCKGTRVNGAAFTFPFEANASPAPAAGDACVPSGKQMPKGTAVMGTAPKASTVFAVVFVPPAKAGGANKSAVGPAAATLVCKGTRANGAAFTFPFEANASPAPAAGDACVPSGKKTPKGTAVMGTAPKASTVFAVVFVPPTKAGGAHTGAAGPAAATLVCKGTRANGAAFTFPFEANTSPAPAPGDACVPSGKKMPKGTAVVGTAPKAAKVFAVVFVPPTSHNTK
jgi:hypothetical protein